MILLFRSFCFASVRDHCAASARFANHKPFVIVFTRDNSSHVLYLANFLSCWHLLLTPHPTGTMHDIWAVPLQLSNFNIIVAVLGGFISLFGLVSYLLKENFYVSEAREFRERGETPLALPRVAEVSQDV